MGFSLLCWQEFGLRLALLSLVCVIQVLSGQGGWWQAGQGRLPPWWAPNSLPTGSQAVSKILNSYCFVLALRNIGFWSSSEGNWSSVAPGTGEPLPDN